MSDRVAVMYLGQIVEEAAADELRARPLHPYLQALIASSLPVYGPDQGDAEDILTGEVPSPLNPPSGCRFHTRCRHASARCASETPALREVEADHRVACHLY